jgi:hypothetical protein
MSEEKQSPQDAVLGRPEWTAAFMDAGKQAVSEAVEEHLRAGNRVYFTDDEGDICELSPDRKTHKLIREEVDQLISASVPS